MCCRGVEQRFQHRLLRTAPFFGQQRGKVVTVLNLDIHGNADQAPIKAGDQH
jgi:hypothetical protein